MLTPEEIVVRRTQGLFGCPFFGIPKFFLFGCPRLIFRSRPIRLDVLLIFRNPRFMRLANLVGVFFSVLRSRLLEANRVLFSVPSKTFVSACSTRLGWPTSLNLNYGVIIGVFVPILTVRGGGSVDSAPSVFGACDDLKVVRVTASFISAQVVKGHVLRDCPPEQLIRPSVNEYKPASFFYPRIAETIKGSNPVPAPSNRIDGDIVEYKLGSDVISHLPALVCFAFSHAQQTYEIDLIC